MRTIGWCSPRNSKASRSIPNRRRCSTDSELFPLPLLYPRRPLRLHRHLEPQPARRHWREGDGVVAILGHAVLALRVDRLPFAAVPIKDAPRLRYAHFAAARVVEP